MKTFLVIFLLFSLQLNAQNGALHIRLYSTESNCYWSNEKVYCQQLVQTEGKVQYLLVDSAFTDAAGWVKFNHLFAGDYRLAIHHDPKQWVAQGIQVQDKQLFISEANLTETVSVGVKSSNYAQMIPGKLSVGEYEAALREQQLSAVDIQRMPTRYSTTSSIASFDSYTESESRNGNLQEVCIVAYRIPLIDNSASSYYSMTREARGMMNTQNTPINWVGAYLNTTNVNQAYVRGARVDANSYYVDGIRVRKIDVTQSMINTSQVITGGIPANYGDVTGGVISVTTSNTSSAIFGPSHNSPRRKSKPVVVDEPKLQFDQFSPIYENQFLATRQNAHSTFGLDVDRASWTYCKRVIEEGGFLSRDAVKVEEFINSFSHKTMTVSDSSLLDVAMERMACPWNNKHQLLAVHLKASDLKQEVERIHHQYTFLIDVSGSMSGPTRLDLVKQGLINLVQHLDERDRVAIVTYAGNESVALYPTTCDQKNIIIRAIERLGAGGSTNGSGGLKMAYALATEMYDPQANNRVILATDGDFNVGISNPKELENYISAQRGNGIYLTAIGVGMGNYRNDILETLADKGDGNHFYIKDAVEADQVLVKDIGNLITVARDVKLDVQFNPELVKEYRLLGYENRLMPSQDFRDDTKDGGEVGVGHQVVALYEIELGTDTTSTSAADTLVYEADDIAAVLLRFKPRKENASVERSFHVSQSADLIENPSLVLSAALALELRNSPFKGTCSSVLLQELAKKVEGKAYEELLKVCGRLVGL